MSTNLSVEMRGGALLINGKEVCQSGSLVYEDGLRGPVWKVTFLRSDGSVGKLTIVFNRVSTGLVIKGYEAVSNSRFSFNITGSLFGGLTLSGSCGGNTVKMEIRSIEDGISRIITVLQRNLHSSERKGEKV